MTGHRRFAAAVIGGALFAAAGAGSGAAGAAELVVLAGGALVGPLGELRPRFEQATGHRLAITFEATPKLIAAATSGAPFDCGVVPVDVYRDAAARARFAPAPTVDVARVGFGVAVKAGAPKPDIATPESFRAALLAAPSIAFLPESAAGAQVRRVFERLGIAEAMAAKTRVQASPAGIPQAVAAGDAALGVFLTNVLTAPGVELVGPFPGDLQQELVFAGALAAAPRAPDAAQAFLDYLRTPEAAAVFRAKGMTPG